MSDSATVGLLHPGEMGSSIGAALRSTGHRVVWASAGRSEATRARAGADGIEDVGDLTALTATSDVVWSVCPPHAALDVARAVAATGFGGVYVDANAVAPATARAIGAVVVAAGATFVDGGIVGPQARRAGTTRCYLSGDAAPAVAARFTGSAVDARVVAGGPGAASALKAAYAAWTKGTAALLLTARALARAEGVEDDLLAEWAISQPDLAARSELVAALTAPRAWRFAGEMDEIASACAADGLPDGFHRAAAAAHRTLADLRHADPTPGVEEVLDALLGREAPSATPEPG